MIQYKLIRLCDSEAYLHQLPQIVGESAAVVGQAAEHDSLWDGFIWLGGDDQITGVAIWQHVDDRRTAVAVTTLACVEEIAESTQMLVRQMMEIIRLEADVEMISVRMDDLSPLLQEALAAQGMVTFERRLMACPLAEWLIPEAFAPPEGCVIDSWEEEDQDAVDALVGLVHEGSIDQIVIPNAHDEALIESAREIRMGQNENAGPAIEPACLVALNEDEEIIGYIVVNEREMMGLVSDVGVDPDYRGYGVGNLLMVVAMQTLQEIGYPACILTVTAGNPAQRMYERLGFKVQMAGRTAVWWHDGRQLDWQSFAV